MLKGKPAFYRKLNQFELSTVNLISKGLFGNLTTPGIIRRQNWLHTNTLVVTSSLHCMK